jgi:quinohemoprotein ethanol dehydrogenase
VPPSELPPAAIATYSSPSTSKTTAGASAPNPVWKRHSTSPVLASIAVAGPAGPIAQDADKIKIGDNNEEYRYWPGRIRVKAGTSVTFTNFGDIAHTPMELKAAKWDTGVLEKGQSKTVTFSEPGNYYYICAPHPWMYGQVIVE